MKLNYKTKTLLSTEEQETKSVEYAIEETKLELLSDILATKQSLKTKQAEFEDAKTTYPLNVMKLANLREEITTLEEGLKFLNELQTELGLEP